MPDTKGLSGCGTHLALIIGEKFVPSVGTGLEPSR